MTTGKKISIQTWSAIAMLATGSIMAFVCVFLPPVGDISQGPLWYIGQCFLYAGAIFGVGSWANTKMANIEKKFEDKLDESTKGDNKK